MRTQSSYQSGSRSADSDATAVAVSSGCEVRRVRFEQTVGEALRLPDVDDHAGREVEVEIGDVDGFAGLAAETGERRTQARGRVLFGRVGPEGARDHQPGHRPVAQREQCKQALGTAGERGRGVAGTELETAEHREGHVIAGAAHERDVELVGHFDLAGHVVPAPALETSAGSGVGRPK